MRYLLLNSSTTSDIKTAVAESIRYAFKIDPRDIRYDYLASMNTLVISPSNVQSETIIEDRIRTLCTKLSGSYRRDISLESFNISGNNIEVVVKINNENITITI
jgi:archaellum component FlaG (FlaF/FlaG flagellin family)